MKIKISFVTNSSSTGHVLALDFKPNNKEEFWKLLFGDKLLVEYEHWDGEKYLLDTRLIANLAWNRFVEVISTDKCDDYPLDREDTKRLINFMKENPHKVFYAAVFSDNNHNEAEEYLHDGEVFEHLTHLGISFH